MRSSWIRLGPKSSDRGEDMETNGGEGYVKMEEDMGVIHLQAKESPRWLAITRIKEGGMEHVSESPEGTNPDETLILGLWSPELWDNKVVFSHPVWGNLLWLPWETKTLYYPDYLMIAFFIYQHIISIFNLPANHKHKCG